MGTPSTRRVWTKCEGRRLARRSPSSGRSRTGIAGREVLPRQASTARRRRRARNMVRRRRRRSAAEKVWQPRTEEGRTGDDAGCSAGLAGRGNGTTQTRSASRCLDTATNRRPARAGANKRRQAWARRSGPATQVTTGTERGLRRAGLPGTWPSVHRASTDQAAARTSGSTKSGAAGGADEDGSEADEDGTEAAAGRGQKVSADDASESGTAE